MTIPARPRRSGRTLLTVLLAILLVGGISAAWVWWQPASQPGVDAGRDVCENFLTALREARAAEGWQSTTAEFKSAQGQEAFVKAVKQAPFLKQPLDFVSVQTVTVNEQPRAEYLYRSPPGTKGGSSVRVVLGREGNAWKVDRWLIE